MLLIECKDEKEFQKIMQIIDDYDMLRLDYQREEPYFITVDETAFKIEFLMTPRELIDCCNKSEALRDKYPFFKQFISTVSSRQPEIDTLLIGFYPAFSGLMLGKMTEPNSLIDISCSDEDLKKPGVQESIRFRETFKKAYKRNKKSQDTQLGTQQFFSQKTDKISETKEHESSVYINKSREYSSNSDQLKWTEYSKEVINELSRLTKEKREINLFDLFRMLGDKRLEIAIELGHHFNYADWDPVMSGSIHLTHYFGALRGVENFSEEVHEIIPLNEKECENPPFHFVKKDLLEKLESNLFKKTVTVSKNNSELHNFKYADKFLDENEENNFSIKVAIYPDKTDGVAHIIYPRLSDLKQLSNLFEKILPYFNVVLNFKTPDNDEEAQAFLEALGKLAYHCFRTLPFRLGTSAITEWLIRGLADSKNISLGPILANTCENKTDWKELPLDWKAFLSFTEEEYAQWFCKNAFAEIKLNGKLIFRYSHEAAEERKTI